SVVASCSIGYLIGGKTKYVVEAGGVREPGDGAVPDPVDGAVDQRTAVDVHHAQQRFLVAAFGELVGQQPAGRVDLPGVQGGQPLRVEGTGVDERPLVRFPAPEVEHGMFLVGRAPGEEAALSPPHRCTHTAGPEKGLYLFGETVP